MKKLTALFLGALFLFSHLGCGSGQAADGGAGTQSGQVREEQGKQEADSSVADASGLEGQTAGASGLEEKTETASGFKEKGENAAASGMQEAVAGSKAETGNGMDDSAADRGSYAEGAQLYTDTEEESGGAEKSGQDFFRHPRAVPVVYMSEEISAQAMLELYKSIGGKGPGQNTAVKVSYGINSAGINSAGINSAGTNSSGTGSGIHSGINSGGTSSGTNSGSSAGRGYLEPELIKDLVQYAGGTIADCGPAAGSLGTGLASGYLEIAEIDRIEEQGTVVIPVRDGIHLMENAVGAGFQKYDSFLILTHFVEDELAGFGGAIHNISIGMSAKEGRKRILDAADSYQDRGQEVLLEAMAEAGLSITEALRGNIFYINVMNGDSFGCDCSGPSFGADIHDIGIFASKDPVALDQACVDYVYMAQEGEDFIRQIEALHAEHILEYGEEIGLGDCAYTVVTIDD